jgi:hypothetical protein
VSVSARATALAQGVGEACSHGPMRKNPSHHKRFRPASAVSWPLARLLDVLTTVLERHRLIWWHGRKRGLEY